jgi:TetR/AcrR family transcriptional regulator, transcriptional repressor for nem operon
MRITREKVAENRERLIEVATDQFRKLGIDGIGVADLMKEAGMSLGSFYGYFDSKEHLVSECCSYAIADVKTKITTAFSRSVTNPVEKTVDEYLSTAHRDEVAKGCGLAALGSEFAHKTEAVHAAATPELNSLFDEMARSLPGSTRKKRREQSIAIMASLMGGLILSRMTDDATLSHDILSSVKAAVKSFVRA